MRGLPVTKTQFAFLAAIVLPIAQLRPDPCSKSHVRVGSQLAQRFAVRFTQASHELAHPILIAETGVTMCRRDEHFLRLTLGGAQCDLIDERQLIRTADFGPTARIVAAHADFNFADMQA